MDNLFKIFERLTETIAANACRPNELRHLAKNHNTSLSRQAAEDISKRHLKVFLERVEDELRELCQHHELEKKFDELARIDEGCATKYGRNAQGYRPIGDPNIDTDGVLSKIKIEYKKSLQRCITDFEEQIQDNTRVIENNTMVMKALHKEVREHYAKNESVMSTKSDFFE